MKRLLIALACLAGCSGDKEPRNGQNMSANGSAAQPKGEPAALAGLTGLYEGPAGKASVDQMCVVEGKGGDMRFGLVVWGANMHSCSGSGIVTRDGDTLRLAMAGDSECTISATISGKTVTVPADIPRGCAYYCGARAKLGGAQLTQKETGRDAALKAQDLVGESLCAGSGG